MTPEATYNPVTQKIADELRGIIGEKYVIFGDADRLEPFSRDEIPDPKYRHMPECVVRPRTAEEIAAIMKLANREHVPVTPRGAGSGLSGGAVPIHGGIVLFIDRMNEILEVDLGNMMVVVEPGVVTSEINEAIKEHGLFYPGYPMSLETCYIGGNVAENAGGGKAVKYGVTGRYVMGIEIVTPTGEIIQLGGKRVKDVTGYDLVSLMVGSEGTLGIFTKIILKLMATPKHAVDLLCLFKTPEEAIAAVPRIMTSGGVVPAAIEFMDQTAARMACEYLNETFPYEETGAMLLINVDGSDEAQVERDYDEVGEQALQAGATEVYVADNATTSERVWRVRRNIAESLSLISHDQCNEDIVVPMAEIPKLVGGLRALSAKYDLLAPCFGHAADGNMHIRIVKTPDWSQAKWKETLPKLLKELYTLASSLGGTLSGEHGIGHKRKPYMSFFCSDAHMELMRSLKRAWDPANVLNPGKMFDI
jgi:glycolate oxidase subunit GlcD